jgi:acetyl esterase/lipase
MKAHIIALSLLTAVLFSSGLTAGAQAAAAQPPQVITGIAYKTGPNLTGYEKQQCRLDVYLPPGRKGFPTLVWFHGGALKAGDKKDIARIALSLAQEGLALVAVEYRLSPKATYPAYIQDGAAAFAWARAHISGYGGDPARLYIGGHSAGAYLALMIGLDPRYLTAAGLSLSSIAGIIPISGQTMTHYTVRAERGIGMYTIIADEAAPVHYCRKDTPPMLVLYADHDEPAREQENEYLVAVMKAAGNQRVTGMLIANRTHGTILGHVADKDDPARNAILNFIKP